MLNMITCFSILAWKRKSDIFACAAGTLLSLKTYFCWGKTFQEIYKIHEFEKSLF